MYEILLSLHSWLRWVVLGLGLYAIYANYAGWQAQRSFTASDKKINTFFIASLHTQLVIGLILYGISPMMKEIMTHFGASMKNPTERFWSVEHMTGMIIGILIAQIGSIKSKKASSDTSKFRIACVYFSIGLLIILLMIPFGIWNPERPLFRV